MSVTHASLASVVPGGNPPGKGRLIGSPPDWYKDSIIYQLHVKAFQDGNGDGIGDFSGLIQRLDYVQELGVDALWLLPFYPSPLRDDGYDIANYTSVHPNYGTLDDFKAFVEKAHRLGIRVITELVINHTSDQHPWFQRARQAPAGSEERDFYVWSKSKDRYQGTRIIFLDTESSNWTWDPVAKAYFWHRFYSHQPDLNFDNPAVLEEIIKVLRFWLDIGVDGLRLDAVPYLVEREGTNNENLPETHAILKRIRKEVDAAYPDRMLLAEANQWPEDTRPYFGDGDECHTAFHFPLMPRMYMALAQEDRYPVTDILRQTPDIPEGCQWALFLRNHDELTLEMVTDDERDYLWRTYAADQRARLNLGIRRRLSPLLQSDRRKIELMNALLFSMPGTPVIYYGDEIGMGDNYYLGDRDGVRTPMQWTADRNGGFSRADPQRLYLPVIMDANFGYQTINIEAQTRDPSSLLNWMRKMIAVRQLHPAFGRGRQTFLYPRNRKVLAFLREYEGDTLLCVFNFSRSAQAVELDLSDHSGAIPTELLGNASFPSIGELPYLLTLPAHGFFWFELKRGADEPHWRIAPEEATLDLLTIVVRGRGESVLDKGPVHNLERHALPDYLSRRRWFAGKGHLISKVALSPLCELTGGERSYWLTCVTVDLAGGERHHYFEPLTVLWGNGIAQPGSPRLSSVIAKVRQGPNVGALVDVAGEPDFAKALGRAIRDGTVFETDLGRTVCSPIGAAFEVDESDEVRLIGAEQSNQSLIIGNRAVLKLYRRVRPGIQPELEVSRFLSEVAHYPNAPALLGLVELIAPDGTSTALASMLAYVPNQGDAWQVLVDGLERQLEDLPLHTSAPEAVSADRSDPTRPYAFPLDFAGRLGQRTAELHHALSVPTKDPAFASEPVRREDMAKWSQETRQRAEEAFLALSRSTARNDNQLKAAVSRLEALRGRLDQRLDFLSRAPGSGRRIRVHGDYHLGQVLVSGTDAIIIDFEGEPGRPLDERRAKTTPMRDVAGMLRSFDYAAWTALERLTQRYVDLSADTRAAAAAWNRQARSDFLAAYRAVAAGRDFYPTESAAADAQLELFLLQKAFYEITYEAANRPAWIAIPVRGVLDLLSDTGGELE